MAATPDGPLVLDEGRFSRFEQIEWWDQATLDAARVLVVGAGALGNEAIKSLALLGAGAVVIVDRDHIEKSNLSRSVLFRERDEGCPKAACAARAAADLYPGICAVPIVGNVLSDVGLGYFRWAQVVVGALDNREARVFVNSTCARLGRPWFDGGIEVLRGIVRGFAPPRTACYECTMSRKDWEILQARRSCSLLAQRARQQRGTPTMPTTASVVAAIQVQEVVKVLHGMEALAGAGYFYDGLAHNSYRIEYRIHPECGCHDPAPPVHAVHKFTSETPLGQVWDCAAALLGSLDAIDLGRDLVEELACPSCGRRDPTACLAQNLPSAAMFCPHCRAERIPRFIQSVTAGSPLLARTPRELGLPTWDILWARRGEEIVGVELAGDAPSAGIPLGKPGAAP